MALFSQRKISVISLLLYWPMLLVFAHVPIPESVQKADVSDKCLHFLAYLVLTFLLWFSIKPGEKVRWNKFTPWLLLFFITGYGAADEIVQSFVGRNCDVMDAVTNFSGALFGLILLTFLRFMPAALVIAAMVIFGMANVSKTNLADIFPIIDGIFSFFSFAIFTILWLLNMNLFFPNKLSGIKRVLITAGMPLCLLILVRFSSFLLGRDIEAEDVILPIAAVLIVTGASYFKIFLPVQTERI